MRYQEWCKKKTEEEYKKIDYIRQIELKKHIANQTRKEASTVAYDHWLKSIGCKKSASHYSHGYSDGKLIGRFHFCHRLLSFFSRNYIVTNSCRSESSLYLNPFG
ncbi:unnamed protein product [Schistosoma mattheei]|uniref:Coiled-coil domain-containing protein n=1 Tax=Schistosoma mattheei TaxID=31246 RepID=A0A3P8KRF3_9TREM|nr:unnamed protein product [Schistosoma mattheei]